MKQLSLYEKHKDLGAHFGPFGDWELPLHYGKPETEVLQVRKTGGMIDRSFMGKLVVTGSDRVTFLQGMVTNDVKRVTLEKGLHSLMVTVKGKIVADFIVLGLEEALLLVLQPELTGKVQSLLEQFVIASDVQIQDGSSQWGILSVHGPSAPNLLERVLGVEVKPKEAYSIEAHRLDQNPIWVIHQQELGTVGFDLLIPSEGVDSFWNVLVSEGANLGVSPFGWQSFDILRIEAGFPRYGHELDETVFPLEAEVADAVNYDKGCYLGQETVTRMKFRGHANRLRIGFEAQGEVPPKKGDPLRCEGKETGWVTSAAFSPLFRKVVGMGYVRRDYSTPGTRLIIQMESGETDATVCALPFVGLGKKSVQ